MGIIRKVKGGIQLLIQQGQTNAAASYQVKSMFKDHGEYLLKTIDITLS
jgi:hypothetical protein